MKTVKTLAFLLATLAVGCSPFEKSEINVRNLNPPAKVIGTLGKPLGTRMVIEGVQPEVMPTNPLNVSIIDGLKLKNSVTIAIQEKFQIKEGVLYRLEGYESGKFDSPPTWVASEAQQPFQFYSFFIVTKVLDATVK